MSSEYMQVYPLQGETIHDTDKGRFRVTVERIDPEPEPEKKLWECQWRWWSGFQARETGRVSRIVCEWTRDGDLFNVSGLVVSTTEPTLAEFAAAVKDATGVEIPMPEEEEPQWWQWDSGRWRPTGSVHAAYTENFVRVYGTTYDRDAKRDALLKAARKAASP